MVALGEYPTVKLAEARRKCEQARKQVADGVSPTQARQLDKAVTRDLKVIYQAATEEAGLQALETFAAASDSRYPQISRSWQSNWSNLATFFAYPADVRKVIYTTNAIESLNSVIRNAIK